MIIEALKEFGTLEAPGAADNPKIIGWQDELEAADLDRVYAGVYTRFDPVVRVVHGDRRPSRQHRNAAPSAIRRASILRRSNGRRSTSVPKGAAALGDVLVFKRKGGGHVGLYVGHDASAFHVLGGNQSDRVTISRLSKQRLVAVRRQPIAPTRKRRPPIPLAASGSLSVNEA